MPVWTKRYTSPELLRRRRLMSLSLRALDRHRHRPPQFMDSAEKRRTGNALVVDAGTPPPPNTHTHTHTQRILPSKGIHLPSLWENKPLGYCVHCNETDSMEQQGVLCKVGEGGQPNWLTAWCTDSKPKVSFEFASTRRTSTKPSAETTTSRQRWRSFCPNSTEQNISQSSTQRADSGMLSSTSDPVTSQHPTHLLGGTGS